MKSASIMSDILREGELKQRGPRSTIDSLAPLLVPIPEAMVWWWRAKHRNRRRAVGRARAFRRGV
jgi:hypothetical protein